MPASVVDLASYRARRFAVTAPHELGTVTCFTCGCFTTVARPLDAGPGGACPACGSSRTTYEAFGLAVDAMPAARGR